MKIQLKVFHGHMHCVFLYAFVYQHWYPLTGGQYYGIFNNPNLFGECLTMAVLCIVFLIEQSEFNNKKKVIFLFALFGIAVALIILPDQGHQYYL